MLAFRTSVFMLLSVKVAATRLAVLQGVFPEPYTLIPFGAA